MSATRSSMVPPLRQRCRSTSIGAASTHASSSETPRRISPASSFETRLRSRGRRSRPGSASRPIHLRAISPRSDTSVTAPSSVDECLSTGRWHRAGGRADGVSFEVRLATPAAIRRAAQRDILHLSNVCDRTFPCCASPIFRPSAIHPRTHRILARRRRLPSRGARTDRAWRRATVLPSSRLPIARSGGSDRPSPCVVPRAAVRPLPRIQSSAEPGRHSFACPRVREDDPECKVSRDLGVGPRRGHLTARIASTQAAGRTKLGGRRVDEVITRHVR
jgi:hypothetical protein